VTKSSQSADLSTPFSARLAKGIKSLQGSVPPDPSHRVKFRPNQPGLPELFPKKRFRMSAIYVLLLFGV